MRGTYASGEGCGQWTAFQVERTADALDKDCRDGARQNIKVVVQAYFAFPGARTFWSNVSAFFEPGVHRFVSDALLETPVSEAESSSSEGRDT